VPLFIQILNSTIQSFPKVTGGEVISRTANSTLNEAEALQKMNDELFLLNIWFCYFNLKVKGQIKDQG
jgi:ATP-dependent Clp protease ATP-binding subunit ClpB